jgi:molybdenum cofactor cytidylyltransferase
MGAPKALLPWGYTTVLRQVIGEVRASGPGEVLLVTGSHREALLKETEPLDIATHHNPDWESGMGSSLASGVREVRGRYPQAGALLVVLVDQPLLSRGYLRRMRKEHGAYPDHIIASDYGVFAGVPALFPRRYWPDLEALGGDRGARGVIAAHKGTCRILDPGLAITDIDTPQAYRQALLKAGFKPSK